MSPHSSVRFPCPACGAALRLRERRFVGATFPCPECAASLTLLSLQNGEAAVQLAEPTAPQDRTQPPSRLLPIRSVAWIGGTILTACVLIGLAWPPAQPPAPDIVGNSPPLVEPPTKEIEQEPPIVAEVEPSDTPSAPVEPPPAPVTPVIVFDLAAEPPISALTAIPAPPIVPVVVRPDAQGVLQQRLSRFEQLQPVSRRDLLTMVEDLIGRPIATPAEANAALDQSLTVSLTDGTVAELVAQILAGTDLQLAITPESARLQRRMATDAATIIAPQ